MNRLKIGALALCLTLAAVVFLPSSQADVWNKKTELTVNEPLAIPGMVLQPGKYVIKLMDSQSNRHIVQVFNEDESKLHTTILAIPNQRLQPTGETQFSFWEMPAGQPRALKAWFYPGDNFGQAFAYPKDLATQIASKNQENVPALMTEDSDLKSAEVKEISPSGEASEMAKTEEQTATAETQTQAQTTPTSPETTTAPTEPGSVRTGTGGEKTETAQVQPSTPAEQPSTPAAEQPSTPATQETAQAQAQPETPAEQPAAVPSSEPAPEERSELPRTASPMPLVGLAGLLSFGAAIAARLISRANG
jgi:hypothetical protein